jgi:hypothetical protein
MHRVLPSSSASPLSIIRPRTRDQIHGLQLHLRCLSGRYSRRTTRVGKGILHKASLVKCEASPGSSGLQPPNPGFPLDGRRGRCMIVIELTRRDQVNAKPGQSETTTGRVPACGRRPANAKSEARSPKQTQSPNAQKAAPAMSAPRQTKPIALYVVGSNVAGHYISKAGCGRRKTKPICAAGGRDWGFGDWEAGSVVWTVRQTNPIYHFRLHRARLRSGRQGVEIRDTLHEIRVRRVDGAPNKPNSQNAKRV